MSWKLGDGLMNFECNLKILDIFVSGFWTSQLELSVGDYCKVQQKDIYQALFFSTRISIVLHVMDICLTD